MFLRGPGGPPEPPPPGGRLPGQAPAASKSAYLPYPGGGGPSSRMDGCGGGSYASGGGMPGFGLLSEFTWGEHIMEKVGSRRYALSARAFGAQWAETCEVQSTCYSSDMLARTGRALREISAGSTAPAS